MQLLIILALLLYGGKQGAAEILEEVKPVLEEYGGDEVKEAIKSAEEISKVLSVVKSFTADEQPDEGGDLKEQEFKEEKREADFFPLAPISNLAGREITYALSEYINAE